MPAQRVGLRMIKDVIRLKWEARLSHDKIATALGISKGVVQKYLALASAASLDWDEVRDWDESRLQQALLPASRLPSGFVEPDWARVHQDLQRKGVTLMLLWQEYTEAHPGGRTWRYTQFCEHYKVFRARLKRSMRQHRRAGEKLFVDYSGPTLRLREGGCAQVFVSAMGASSYTFACATPAQKLDDWIEGMVRSIAFMGAVPHLVVPDNPRALIAEPDRYEPQANATVLDFARHYGTSVLPARPYHPQDKAAVESAVQVVGRWILASLRHRVFDTVAEADAAIQALLPSLNGRLFRKLPGSRASVFAEVDRPAMLPLPPAPYELARFKTVKVHIDYHVEVDAHYYSVPHALVGQALEARLTRHLVEVLHRGQRVASHVRSHHRGGFTTVDEHMPAAHRAHKEWSPQRLVAWGEQVGAATGVFVTRVLSRYQHPEHGYRACLGLLSLARRYGRARLEAACESALVLGTYRCKHVREMLKNNRDRLTQPTQGDWVSPQHDNLRGPQNYQ
jgi:transposase